MRPRSSLPGTCSQRPAHPCLCQDSHLQVGLPSELLPAVTLQVFGYRPKALVLFPRPPSQSEAHFENSY